MKAAIRAHEDKGDEEQKKLAAFDVLDETSDDDIEAFKLHPFALVKKQRSDPRYVHYFEDGLREITTAEPRKDQPA